MKLAIPAGDFAGYIFDLDGTLVDTMPLHYRAWNRAMQRAGLKEELSEDLFYSLGGMPTRRVASVFATHYGLLIDVEKVFHEKEALFMPGTASSNTRHFSGGTPSIQAAEAAGMKWVQVDSRLLKR